MFNIFRKPKISKDQIAKLLNTNTQLFKEFEDEYQKHTLPLRAECVTPEEKKEPVSDTDKARAEELVTRIVSELIPQCETYVFDKNGVTRSRNLFPANSATNPVSPEEIYKLPKSVRPQLTGSHMTRDIDGETYEMLLDMYKSFLEEKNPKKKKGFYDRFRQGLDLYALDGVMYEMLSLNPNAMSYWLSQIYTPVTEEGFFKIPETKIIKVPLTVLQLTRLEFMSLTQTTKDIVSKLCSDVLSLDPAREYFIKTGTYSNKFDFRNAHIFSPSEVNCMGEYFLFTQFQANCMAHYDLSGGNRPCIYGVSTTNEWVVREYIPPVSAPSEPVKEIYHGLPLRTEYRIFVDFGTNEVLAISPYWEPNLMKKRFGASPDSGEPDMVHDYITFSAAEPALMEEYEKNKDEVIRHIEAILPQVNLAGQWSIDIMQNGNDFWLIDMAIAENSALYECVPEEKRRISEENWLPDLSGGKKK